MIPFFDYYFNNILSYLRLWKEEYVVADKIRPSGPRPYAYGAKLHARTYVGGRLLGGTTSPLVILSREALPSVKGEVPPP